MYKKIKKNVIGPCRAGPRAQPPGPGTAQGVPRAWPGLFSPCRAWPKAGRAGVLTGRPEKTGPFGQL